MAVRDAGVRLHVTETMAGLDGVEGVLAEVAADVHMFNVSVVMRGGAAVCKHVQMCDAGCLGLNGVWE